MSVAVNGSADKNGSARTVRFPKSKIELDSLIERYQQLLRLTKEAKEKLDSHSLKERFVDVHASEKRAIEGILAQVSEKYDEYVEQEAALLEELLDTLNGSDEKVDCALLEKQLAGLQMLTRDMDLPPSLQLAYEGSEPKQATKEEVVQHLLKQYFSGITSADYLQKAQSVGLRSPLSQSSVEPLLAPLGNYYAEQIISSKIASRVAELEGIPANLGTFEKNQVTDSLKIKALIELKSLHVLAVQKSLKNNFLRKVALTAHYDLPELANNPLVLQGRRGLYIRDKIDQPNPRLLALQLEEKFKLEAEAKEHRKRTEKLSRIQEASKEYLDVRGGRAAKRALAGRFVVNFHTNTERDELKKLEKTAKQRLQALKANDEEAYIKLLDQTKDHRITHLLKQTNSFLDSLAKAVKDQQAEDGAIEENPDELREKIDYYQVAHRIKEEVKEQPSILVGGQLKEYQLKGLQWMVSLYNNKLNGILADEMGLGKTIQLISLVTYLIEKKNEDKFLVIVPLSTITNWTVEFEKWAPSVKVIVYKGSPQQRREMQYEIRLGNFQVMLTTYEYIIRERPVLAKFHYSHMIIDEGHRMKNTQSKLSITLKQYYSTNNRLILTGTPLQNNLPELWALLNFVLPKIFKSAKSFDEWFNTPFANTGSQEKIELTEEESLLIIRRLHKVLRPFLLRRLKKDVEKDLPDKVEKVLKCNLSGLQHVLYQQMIKHNALFVGAKAETSSKLGIRGLNNKIMQLRKICNHPFVFEEVEDVLNSSRLTNDLLWRTLGKFELLDRILPKFQATGHKVLIFFQMTQVMNIFEDFLRLRNMKYLRLDGATKAEDRQDMLKSFNAPEADYFCFLLSTRAGGLGLNLQSADTVIIFDTDWNPHQDLQAQDRAHRIGQKNEVRILRLITNDSVEELILERAHQKLDIDGKVIQAGKFDNKSTAEEQEEFLKRLLETEQGDGEIEENENLDDEELNDILARNEDEKKLFMEMDTERLVEEKMQGRLGGYTNRLITKDELPEVFTEDISHHFEKDTKELTRMREKKRVKYDDGLTEEQWLMAMDDDNDTVEAAIRRKEDRRKKRKPEDDDEPRKRSRSFTPVDDRGYEEGGDPLNARCEQVLKDIEALVSEKDGHSIAAIFLKLPLKKQYADYYKIIKRPTAISQIRRHLRQEKYDTFESFLAELRLMCSNAKTYNQEGLWVYEDAQVVENLLDAVLGQ